MFKRKHPDSEWIQYIPDIPNPESTNAPIGEPSPLRPSSPLYLHPSSPPRPTSPPPVPEDLKQPSDSSLPESTLSLVILDCTSGPSENLWHHSEESITLVTQSALEGLDPSWEGLLALINDSELDSRAKRRLEKYTTKCRNSINQSFERVIRSFEEKLASPTVFSLQSHNLSRSYTEFCDSTLRLVRNRVASCFADSPLVSVVDKTLFVIAHRLADTPFLVLRRLELLRGLGSRFEVI